MTEKKTAEKEFNDFWDKTKELFKKKNVNFLMVAQRPEEQDAYACCFDGDPYEISVLFTNALADFIIEVTDERYEEFANMMCKSVKRLCKLKTETEAEAEAGNEIDTVSDDDIDKAFAELMGTLKRLRDHLKEIDDTFSD